jgi:hypothetical protein
MRLLNKAKCLYCEAMYCPDHRCRKRQRCCFKPECRKASKAESQRLWLSKCENKNYFRGLENTQRVQRWREDHPDYWRRTNHKVKTALQDSCKSQSVGNQPIAHTRPISTLQDPCGAQSIDNERLASASRPVALQEICQLQPAMLVGLIAALTGTIVEEEIAQSAYRFWRGGQILSQRS